MAAEVDPLQAALQTAFEESPITPIVLSSEGLLPSRKAPEEGSSQTPASTTEAVSPQDDEWKQEYNRQQNTWRMESAIARENAEANRERWSKIREKEEIESNVQPKKTSQSIEASTSPVSSLDSAQLSSTSIVSTEVTVTGDAGTVSSFVCLFCLFSLSLNLDTRFTITLEALSSSRAWEEIPSLPSSFPSFSFRESSSGSHEHPELPPYLPPPKPSSVTLAVFNGSLSKRARVLAFVSSLAINLFLPFINGVMLGFGEIFAKNVVVGYFGWDIPGSGVGIRTRVRSQI